MYNYSEYNSVTTDTSVVRAEENQAGFPNEKGSDSNGRLEFLVGPWKVIVFILLILGKIAHSGSV